MLLRWLFLFWMNINLCGFIHWLLLLLYFLLFSHSSRFLCINIFKHFLTQILMNGKNQSFVFSHHPISCLYCLPSSPSPPTPHSASHTLYLDLHLSLHGLWNPSQPPCGNLNSSSCVLPPAFVFLPLSQYFDEEQDDHEYPYYYEETTGIPSFFATPSPQPGAPNQQVKRERERGKTRAGFVEGRENEREREAFKP